MYDLRREIFGHLQKLELSYYDRNPVGRLMTRVTSDVEVLNELFSSGVVTVFGDVFTLAFIMGAMLIMDWQLALVTMLVIPLVFVAAQVFRARVRDAYRDIRVRLARINAFLQERITGMPIVQLFGREQETSQRFRRIDRDYLDAHLRSITYYAVFFPVIELLTATAFALIISYGGAQILDARAAGLAGSGITVGVLAAFLQWARRFFQPIQDLSEKYNMLQGAMASSERIFNLLDTEPPRATHGARMSLPDDARGRIEFRDVWFAYGRRDDGEWDWVLRGISFTVEPGQRLAVVGHTGAGKTSLISLLMRFYEPQRGEILFDGIPIRQIEPGALRERIGLVLQDVFLFSRDIAYNIRLGDSSIDDARVTQAAQRVGADTMIRRLPHGYAEPLGERGASLSVGERQLLSFARALAFDPLVLVLDEATSSVDSALEARIEQALDMLMRGRTSIVIAHRLSTVQNADRILVLHHGELREQGTHASLLERGGLYARLHELQFVRAQPALRRASGA
jgi:ABC-type multidrug transport system fused ATPase/permease subunit